MPASYLVHSHCCQSPGSAPTRILPAPPHPQHMLSPTVPLFCLWGLGCSDRFLPLPKFRKYCCSLDIHPASHHPGSRGRGWLLVIYYQSVLEKEDRLTRECREVGRAWGEGRSFNKPLIFIVSQLWAWSCRETGPQGPVHTLLVPVFKQEPEMWSMSI